jgi:hypothetical protein
MKITSAGVDYLLEESSKKRGKNEDVQKKDVI